MQRLMYGYFLAEKRESLLFVAAGLAALAASAWLLRGGGPFRAMALPLAAVALIQLAVGTSVYLRTEPQVAALAARLEKAPADYRREETARMERVMAGFRLYKALEMALLAAGIGLCLTFRRQEALYAAGIGLVIQSALMLVLDLFAEKRGQDYLDAVQRLLSAG
jgi:hypothetical protein